jgi:polysaccharide pyruvyl transferase WcaK-like protein
MLRLFFGAPDAPGIIMKDHPTLLLKTAWSVRNIGDIGFTPGLLAILARHLPGTRVILWVVRWNEAVEAMVRRRFPGVSIVRGGIDHEDEPDTEELRAAFGQADFVLHNTSMGEDPSMMRAARKRGIPYGMFGQSYFPKIRERRDVLEALNDAAFVYCRDSLTLETLKQAGITSPVLDFNADSCFGIDVRDDAAAEAFLAEKGLQPDGFMTLQLRSNTPKNPGGSAPTDPTIRELNPEAPTQEQMAEDERRAAVFRELITGWVEATAKKVLIAPEIEEEIAHNKRLLLDPLPEAICSEVVLREHFWNSDEAASVFGRASLVVCHEPHSCIIGMASGTPALHLYSPEHGPKYQMFADLGAPEFLLPLDETPAETIFARMLDLDRHPEAARAIVNRAMGIADACWTAACGRIQDALSL